jgi:hypothetical protein
VGVGEGLDALGPPRRESQADDSLIVVVVGSLHQPCSDGAVDELDDAVVAQEEVVGHLADRRRRSVAADGKEQLVLGTGEAHGLGLLLAPALEAAQPVAERQQTLEVLVVKGPASLSHIGSR